MNKLEIGGVVIFEVLPKPGSGKKVDFKKPVVRTASIPFQYYCVTAYSEAIRRSRECHILNGLATLPYFRRKELIG
ncbi:MAG: hypothetical protein Q8O68_01305 [Candidatus Daviesbacteria bacterium]|nr:hypothetical protein [Candidatus Daviesbacteria bacterium]